MRSSFGRLRKAGERSVGPAVESLESRAYFSAGTPDLVASLPGTLAPSAISGAKFNGRISVNVANNGDGKTSGAYTFTLFASTDSTLDSGDSQIYTAKRGLSVRPQKNKTLVFRVPTLPVNLDGSYHILAQVTGAQASATGASGGVIAITPAHVDLSDTPATVPHTAALGKKMNVVLTIANGGNVAAKGVLDIAFAASSDPTGSAPFGLGTVTAHVNIKPSASKVLHLRVPLPLGAMSGNQYIVATVMVDPKDGVVDSNLLNNVSVSVQPVSLH